MVKKKLNGNEDCNFESVFLPKVQNKKASVKTEDPMTCKLKFDDVAKVYKHFYVGSKIKING